MVRKQILLDKTLNSSLTQVVIAENVSFSKLVRVGMSEYLGKQGKKQKRGGDCFLLELAKKVKDMQNVRAESYDIFKQV